MNGSVRSSAGLLWRHQRLVWWIFAVNLVMAWAVSLPVRATLSSVLDHSLESAKLVTGFDIGTLVLMLERPDVSARALAPGVFGAGLVFLFYLLLIDGGVFAVLLDDRKLSREEFFENSGLFFWRMVRLALFSLVPFGLLIAANFAIADYAGKLSSDAPWERLGFFVNVAGRLVIVLVALFVRLWFDLTQARVVLGNERRLVRVLFDSLGLAFRSGKLYAEYIGIGLFATGTFAIGIGVWAYLPHSAMGASFVVLELVTLTQIASRLWFKAASARWVALLPGTTFPALLPMEQAPTPVNEVTDAQSPQPE
jgi:hypothetical protein